MLFGASFIAIVVGAIVAFMLGALWYSPILFGKAWMKYKGNSDPQASPVVYEPLAKKWLETSVLFGVVAAQIGIIGDLQSLLILAIVLWAGFTLPSHYLGHAFGGHPVLMKIIDAGYHLCAFALIGVVYAVLG